MNELLKRKKELDEEYEEIMEMDSDMLNVKSNMTISALGTLLEKLVEYFTDMAEIAKSKKYYDENLGSNIQSTISEIKTAFSQIQPPTINVTPSKIDLQPFQSIANQISKQNETILSLINRQNSSPDNSDELHRLIVAMVGKNNAFLERSFEQINYTNNFTAIEKAVNNRPTEWKAKVTLYNNQGRIDELTIKTIK